MDENKAEGTVRNLGGKVEGMFGSMTGDAKLKAEGAADRVAGSAQKIYGQASDSVRDGVDTIRSKAREMADDGGSQVLDQIEEAGDYIAEQVDNRPVTALLIAAGIGFLIALASKPATRTFRR